MSAPWLVKFCLSALTLLLTTNSCQHRMKNRIPENDSIMIFHYRGWAESPIDVGIIDLSEMARNHQVDTTIYADEDNYHKLLSIVEGAKPTTFKGNIDCRLLVRYGSTMLGFPYPDRLNNDTTKIYGCNGVGEYIAVNADNIYYIKKLIGYYNYFPIEDLMYDKIVRRYGIPANYHNCNKNNKNNVLLYQQKTKTAIRIKDINPYRVMTHRKIVVKQKVNMELKE